MSDSKNKPMTRTEMIQKINQLTGVSVSIIKNVITEYENTILLDLTLNHESKVGCIGKIKIKETKSRVALNPTTGEKLIIPAKTAPKFSFSKGLKEYISKNIKLV